MNGAGWYLFSRTTANRVRRLGRQLRQPRTLLVFLLGAGYLVLVFWFQHQGDGGGVPTPVAASGGTALLLFLVLKWWLFGADRLALAFTPAEVQFLFPAPVSRASLLGYKLARAQATLCLNVAVWTLLIRPGGPSPLGWPGRAAALWVYFTTLFLHRLGVALTRDALTEHGRAGLRRALPAVSLLGLIILATFLSLRGLAPGGPPTVPTGPLASLSVILATPPLSWLLWPFRLPTLALSATDISQWATGMMWGLAVVAGHTIWVLRADRAFEEAAVEASARRASRLERWRRHGPAAGRGVVNSRWRLPLAPMGHPTWAIVWKSVTRFLRTSPLLVTGFPILLLLAGLAYGIWNRGAAGELFEGVGLLALTWAALSAVFGPQWIRADLRGDIEFLPLLRTWPLAGRHLMGGYVLSAALILTVFQALLTSIGVVALRLNAQLDLELLVLVCLGAAGLPAVLGLNLVGYTLQNAAALLYPGWVKTDSRPGGIEAAGQQMLSAGLYLLIMILAAAGPAGLGAGIVWATREALGTWSLIPGLLSAALGLGLEAFLLLDWLGTRFEETDLSTL